MAASAVLRALSATKNYGETVALQNVSLSVVAGESVAIMGPSGCGKSTLLHVLAGIIAPDSGDVFFSGGGGEQNIVLLGDEERAELRLREFGFVFQQGMLLPELTAAENLAVPLMLAGRPRRDATRHAQGLLDEVGLAGLEHRRIGQLSGGQAQRVAVARAITSDASVVFADEPTGALDSRTAGEVLDLLLRQTVAQGRALVMVTHDEEIAGRCHRIVRMRDGRLDTDSREAS